MDYLHGGLFWGFRPLEATWTLHRWWFSLIFVPKIHPHQCQGGAWAPNIVNSMEFENYYGRITRAILTKQNFQGLWKLNGQFMF